MQLDSVGGMLVFNFLFSLFDLAAKMIDRGDDGFLLNIWFGSRARDAITAQTVGAGHCGRLSGIKLPDALALARHRGVFIFFRGLPPCNSSTGL